jgi:hypothetical protein
MNRTRHLTVSAAVIVLICFFLPWVQVSCAGIRDTASGFDLARDGHGQLWLVPLLMSAIIVLGLSQVWKRMPAICSLVSTAGGLISAYLMNHEFINSERASGLIGAQVTGWFWLGFVSSVVVLATAITSYLQRSKSE